MRKTEILKIKGDWREVVDDCRATVKKSPLGKEPSTAFKKAILISEHSPIRDISVKFSWKNIKYWVAMHWKTHHWESRVDSQRNDRQSRYDREKAPQDAPIDFYGYPNIQHTIDTWQVLKQGNMQRTSKEHCTKLSQNGLMCLFLIAFTDVAVLSRMDANGLITWHQSI